MYKYTDTWIDVCLHVEIDGDRFMGGWTDKCMD